MTAIDKMLNQNRYDPAQVRQRIVDQFSVNSLVINTEHVLSTLLSGDTGPVKTNVGRDHTTSCGL